MQDWENSKYQLIKDVKLVKDTVVTYFENGDIVKILKDQLSSFEFKNIEWEKLTHDPYEIFIPATPYSLEISWDKLRVLTDKNFAKYLANREEEKTKLIGIKIKRLRENKGFRSNELAERAGVTPQTISRIEQGHTDVSYATLKKILVAMGYTLRDLAYLELEHQMDGSKRNMSFLFKKLKNIGIDTNLITSKIIPKKIVEFLNTHKNAPIMLLDEAASYISTVYGWNIEDIWDNNQISISNEPYINGYFKTPLKANVNQIKAYSHYAYYLSKVILKTYRKEPKNYPTDTQEFKAILKNYGTISFPNLLNCVWDLGICILPLNDPGVFHGASWNIDGYHVIVVKQSTSSHARWVFNLLHELYHVFVHLQKPNTSIVESEEITPFSNNDSIEELEANSFANQVIFGGKAEKLAEKCVESSNWKLENLKKAVNQISKEENVGADFLANYLAYRLTNQGENWWGTATKMQINDPDPFKLAVDFLRKKISIDKLTPIDNNLLSSALTI